MARREARERTLVVLSFIYTSCNDVNGCPLATFVMRGVQNKVSNDVQLRKQVRLSFSFDPDHDIPKVPAAYSHHFRASYLTGGFLAPYHLHPILEGYGQRVTRDYDAQNRARGRVSHLLRVFLIDKD
ncbi:MAG: SCO family protein [Pseudomonadales bacterium]|jgi:cytochrome oxidase Cu insertion factor (SCO1/SenC/PrrC family)|nr:SCO family protein [Pseudomonadales bacterium]